MGELMRLQQQLCQTRTRRMALLLGMTACATLVFHTFTLPSTNHTPPTFPTMEVAKLKQKHSPDRRVGEFALLSSSGNETVRIPEEVDGGGAQVHEGGGDSDFDDGEIDPDKELMADIGGGVTLKKVRDPVGGFITLVRVNETESKVSDYLGEKLNEPVEEGGVSDLPGDGPAQHGMLGDADSSSLSVLSSNMSSQTGLLDVDSRNFSGLVIYGNGNASESGEPTSEMAHPDNGLTNLLGLNFSTESQNSTSPRYPLMKKKRRAIPTVSISEMSSLLLKNRVSYRTMRPRRSSVRDQEILTIRSQINNAPIVKNDKELHAPAFQNLSAFKRSYDLMEKILKVYVYREGEKPVFHQPLLKGIYASEGWFMKLMEGNKHFVVKDPRKAHLFYLPFSSRFLEFSVYVPNSHNRMNLRTFLGNYVNTIAAKYPFWNRTGGTDHFLVACHDWAPFETKNVMDRPIRALCNADLSNDFRLGKDISLPETYVRFGRDPLKDIGGRPAREREIFAFYAGNMHGYLRPILLNHWENKDPDMKILGPMPPGVKSKTNYIQYMKNSKYCICPRGYEVNSPRVVEAIFYECVPVIISDNYVPPFFEVLNWEAFSVFVPESDVPELKNILKAIPEEKYLSLQMGVKKVQQHFIWHPKAVKYDLFHMILHSIWYNRVYTIKPR